MNPGVVQANCSNSSVKRLNSAIEQTDGMMLDEYRSIYDAAQDDPQLAARLIELFQERERESE